MITVLFRLGSDLLRVRRIGVLVFCLIDPHAVGCVFPCISSKRVQTERGVPRRLRAGAAEVISGRCADNDAKKRIRGLRQEVESRLVPGTRHKVAAHVSEPRVELQVFRKEDSTTN